MRLLNKIVFTFLTNVLTFISTFKGQQLPLWTWNCIDDKCVPTKATKYGKLQSLVTCNMLCTSLQLWPKPTGVVIISNTAVPVRADLFKLKILSFPSVLVREHLIEAFELFRQDLRKIERNNLSIMETWHAVEIRIAINESGSNDPRMLYDTDESYRLQLNPNSSGDYLVADVSSNSFCGARQALETLLQLVWLDPYVGSLLIVDIAKVSDAPRFSYRGLMLDSVQNYFPINDIIKTIDLMAASKLNTFHWHASDSHGLSIFFKSLSQLVHYEFYKHGALYSPDDVRVIVRHARKRGIRVLLEIDLSMFICNNWNWRSKRRQNGLSHHNTESARVCYSKYLCNESNPDNPHIYRIIGKLYAEIIQLTEVDDIFHLGSENIYKDCSQHLNKTDPIDTKIQFTRKVLQSLESANKKLPNLIILWSNYLSERLKIDLKTYIHKLGIQVRDVPWTKNYLSGIRTIISHEDTWNFNSGCGDWDANSGGANYNSWQRVYEHRPWSWKTMAYLEGGEATVWSSTLGAGGLEARIWPRVAALGERLWSDHAEGATQLVQARLDVHRSRLRNRNIQAAPLWSMWCTQNTC